MAEKSGNWLSAVSYRLKATADCNTKTESAIGNWQTPAIGTRRSAIGENKTAFRVSGFEFRVEKASARTQTKAVGTRRSAIGLDHSNTNDNHEGKQHAVGNSRLAIGKHQQSALGGRQSA